MNPKHFYTLALILILVSCSTSSNFQKRKHLKLKPLETVTHENEVVERDNLAIEYQQQSKVEENTPSNYENQKEFPGKEIDESTNFLAKSDDIVLNNAIIENRQHPQKTIDKKELFEPFEATHMEEQKKGIIFISIAAGFYVIAGITFSLLFGGVLSPLVGSIIIGVCIAALIVLGILAIINGKRALNGKKENAWHWIARIAALAGGIISLIAAGLFLGNLVFFLLFF